ncbi:hypothetical protein LX64_02561 [Chitinophaga skermanii]|uniref:DUF6249 domain-containing protein n=1 Tax=Chitinophaga skermanii TaxID=331697 RepID=A0A327QPX4_9BACT|nr:DUF6249 domain-containing protein [Chitinophaga skermanii]RAJ05403.1 hypothetical protein LX64_02561 [Chitinophaga skermanii]
MQITSAAVLIAMALTIFSLCYYYFTTRHKERLTLLEKGLPGDFFSKYFNFRPFLLVSGIVLISIALGTVVGLVLQALLPTVNYLALSFASILVFTGLGLIVSYFVLPKKR